MVANLKTMHYTIGTARNFRSCGVMTKRITQATSHGTGIVTRVSIG